MRAGAGNRAGAGVRVSGECYGCVVRVGFLGAGWGAFIRQADAHKADQRAEQRGAPGLPREGHLAWWGDNELTYRLWAGLR